MALHPGTIYHIGGKPRLYVRTEARAGTVEHLFVHVDNRVIFTHWTQKIPRQAELIVDEDGRAQANEERWLRLAAEHNNEILIGLLRKACAWLPRERGNELRQEYAVAQPKRED